MSQAADRPGADFGVGFAELYTKVCADWPRGDVPAAFYTLPAAPAATLVLSGGMDPATPPRHGERVATALGAKARHVVVPHAGHGVLGVGCMRDVLFRFIDAAADDQALKVEAAGAYPVVVTLRNADSSSETTIRAKYVVGCDGARSAVRDSIGAVPRGDFANQRLDLR